jgi:hypothetical protein
VCLVMLCRCCGGLQVRPLEDSFKFGSFFTPLLHESDFEAKPSVLLLGQYSTGTCPPSLCTGVSTCT